MHVTAGPLQASCAKPHQSDKLSHQQAFVSTSVQLTRVLMHNPCYALHRSMAGSDCRSAVSAHHKWQASHQRQTTHRMILPRFLPVGLLYGLGICIL
jgi:hypothetical protein